MTDAAVQNWVSIKLLLDWHICFVFCFRCQSSGNKIKKRFPGAMIIGASKAGTRALLDFLTLHPLIVGTGPEACSCKRHDSFFSFYCFCFISLTGVWRINVNCMYCVLCGLETSNNMFCRNIIFFWEKMNSTFTGVTSEVICMHCTSTTMLWMSF